MARATAVALAGLVAGVAVSLLMTGYSGRADGPAYAAEVCVAGLASAQQADVANAAERAGALVVGCEVGEIAWADRLGFDPFRPELLAADVGRFWSGSQAPALQILVRPPPVTALGAEKAAVTGGLVATGFWCGGGSCVALAYELYVDSDVTPDEILSKLSSLVEHDLNQKGPG